MEYLKFILDLVKALISFIRRVRNNESRKTLDEKSKIMYRYIKNEKLYFDEVDGKQVVFPKLIKLTYNSEKSSFDKMKLCSYLLKSEAGFGKTTLMKQDYLDSFKKKKALSTIMIFFESSEIIYYLSEKECQNKLVMNLNESRFRKYILYFDGIDEIGDEKAESFINFINKIIDETSGKVIIKMSCRTNYAEKYIEKDLHESIRIYTINAWSEESLKKLANNILAKILKKNHCELEEKYRSIENYINDSNKWKGFIINPLFMKMMMYIFVKAKIFESIEFDNIFNFYSKYFITLLLIYSVKTKTLSEKQINNILDQFAEESIIAFQKNEKKILYKKELKPLFKKLSSEYVSFVHNTYFEYFVARYYWLTIRGKNIKKIVNTLSFHGTNNYSDFITFALNSCSESEKTSIEKKYYLIYSLTLKREVVNKFLSILGKTQVKIDKECYRIVNELNWIDFLNLKIEIIFRLGRLDVSSHYNEKILEFIYYYDRNVGAEAIKRDRNYYITFIKRCCAISASFLGSEKIEMDYVKKMLPFCSEYNSVYDLVNRSHTVIYYGDVPADEWYMFRDDNYLLPYEKALEKRFQRLKKELPITEGGMTTEKIRIKNFRLFDLATIYTFLISRKRKLTNIERAILKACIVDPFGSSVIRNKLMKDILSYILKDCK